MPSFTLPMGQTFRFPEFESALRAQKVQKREEFRVGDIVTIKKDYGFTDSLQEDFYAKGGKFRVISVDIPHSPQGLGVKIKALDCNGYESYGCWFRARQLQRGVSLNPLFHIQRFFDKLFDIQPVKENPQTWGHSFITGLTSTWTLIDERITSLPQEYRHENLISERISSEEMRAFMIDKVPTVGDYIEDNTVRVLQESKKTSFIKANRLKEVIHQDLLKSVKPLDEDKLSNRIRGFYTTYEDISVTSKFTEKLVKAQKLKRAWAQSNVKKILNTPIEVEVEDIVDIPTYVLDTVNIILLLNNTYGDVFEDSKIFKGIDKESKTLSVVQNNSFGKNRPKLGKDLKSIFKKVAKWKENSPSHINPSILLRVKNLLNTNLEGVLEALADYYGKRGGKSTRTFYVTDDVVEMLGASENCGWSSCFRIEGEYHQGAIGCARTSSVLMAYEVRDKYENDVITNKLSRAWVLFDEEAKVLKVPTLYSSTNGREAIRISLANKLADMLWTTERPNSKGAHLEIEHNGNFYEDGGSVRCKNEEDNSAALFIEEGMTPDGYDCCDGYFQEGEYCECCDYRQPDGMYVDSTDIWVCDGCLDEYYHSCDSCGTTHHMDDMTTPDDGRTVCESCLEDDYIYVESANDYLRRDDACYCDYSNEYYPEGEVTYIEDYGDVADVYLDEFYEEHPEYHPDYEEEDDES